MVVIGHDMHCPHCGSKLDGAGTAVECTAGCYYPKATPNYERQYTARIVSVERGELILEDTK